MKNKNRAFYILSKVFFLSMVIDPIFVLYAYDSGLTATQLFTLSSIQTLTIILLELPTGIISDVYGCKVSMIIGSIAFLAANMIFIVKPVFGGFLIGEILTGLYKVLFSGSDESYLYLELQRFKREDEYTKLSGFIDSLNFVL